MESQMYKYNWVVRQGRSVMLKSGLWLRKPGTLNHGIWCISPGGMLLPKTVVLKLPKPSELQKYSNPHCYKPALHRDRKTLHRPLSLNTTGDSSNTISSPGARWINRVKSQHDPAETCWGWWLHPKGAGRLASTDWWEPGGALVRLGMEGIWPKRPEYKAR